MPLTVSSMKSAACLNSLEVSKYFTDSSFTLLSGINAAAPTITRVEIGSSALRLVTTKSPSLSIKVTWSSALGLADRRLTGSSFSNAGNIVTDRKHAISTPSADKLPKSRSTGESDMFIIKKPIAVVTEVIKIGIALSLMLY